VQKPGSSHVQPGWETPADSGLALTLATRESSQLIDGDLTGNVLFGIGAAVARPALRPPAPAVGNDADWRNTFGAWITT
jgi:hypothetical protein